MYNIYIIQIIHGNRKVVHMCIYIDICGYIYRDYKYKCIYIHTLYTYSYVDTCHMQPICAIKSIYIYTPPNR